MSVDNHFKGPNILITGTPGTGKTTTAREIASATGLNYINISELAKENKFIDNWDESLQTWELDDDKVIDEIDETMKEGRFFLWEAIAKSSRKLTIFNI